MDSWYTPPHRILVADDDRDLLNLVGFAFQTAGYDTVGVSTGSEALAAMKHDAFAVLVLDINMPAPNGLEVCSIVRRNSNVPVMMLSAHDRESDLLEALEAGADAYLTKPFSPRILIARVGALIRRASANEPQLVSASGLKLDANESQLVHRAGVVPLTRLELRLLSVLMTNAGKPVEPRHLMAEVWNGFSTANRNTLKQVVFRLRRKLADVPYAGNALQTIDGGYGWQEDSAPLDDSHSQSERTAHR